MATTQGQNGESLGRGVILDEVGNLGRSRDRKYFDAKNLRLVVQPSERKLCDCRLFGIGNSLDPCYHLFVLGERFIL
jgi:hypothetical protein